MGFDVAGAADAGTRYSQTVTSSTPENAKSGVRMEDSFGAWRRDGKTIVAVADGHGSTEVAKGVWKGGREAADAALRAVENNASRDIITMFAHAQASMNGIQVSQIQEMRADGTVAVTNAKGQWEVSTHGTTLCVAVLEPSGRASFGYVGDTMALIVAREGAVSQFAGQPHTAKNAAEVTRMRATGATKMKSYFDVKAGRETYSLQVSRALGHIGNTMVLHEPEQLSADPGWQAIVIGTDGIWDSIGAEDAAKLARAYTSSQEAADAIIAHVVSKSKSKRTQDNAAVVVVKQRAGLEAGEGGCCTVS